VVGVVRYDLLDSGSRTKRASGMADD